MGERWTVALAAYLKREPRAIDQDNRPRVRVMKPGVVEGDRDVLIPLPQFLAGRNG